MPLSRDDLSFKVDMPAIPDILPVTRYEAPCIKDAAEKTRAFADALGIDIMATVAVPHGLMAGGERGQVEVFAASGAVRGRNTALMVRYEDERRDWPDLEKVEGPDGIDFQLGPDTAKMLTHQTIEILSRAGLGRDFAGARVVLERWAALSEDGAEIDAGPGRATVSLSYEVAGVPLIGPGAKSNLHFDPSDRSGELVRFFHVNRPSDEVAEMRTVPLESAFDAVLSEQWSRKELNPGDAHVVITGATFGLLALPAHISQHHALPALSIEGFVRGDFDGLDEIHFARYLPLFDQREAAERGFSLPVDAGPGQFAPEKARTHPRRAAA